MHHICENRNSGPITFPTIRQNYGMYSPMFAATAGPPMLKCPDPRMAGETWGKDQGQKVERKGVKGEERNMCD